MAAQAFQVGVAIAPAEGLEPTLLWTMAAMFSIANMPLAVVLFATALVTFRTHAFPVWLGCLSVVAALAQMVLFAGTVVRSGPLAPPNGWLTVCALSSDRGVAVAHDARDDQAGGQALQLRRT
jgi:hypothetical protein